MKKRILSFMLVIALLVPLFPCTAFADYATGDTLEGALARLDIAYREGDLDWLTLKGTVRTQWYTYFRFNNKRTSQIEEHPVYCIDPDLRGVPKAGILPDGTESMEYYVSDKVGDARYVTILNMGYPHRSLASLGLSTQNEAYYATKMALWAYILGCGSTDFGINPAHAGDATAQKVYDVALRIFTESAPAAAGGIVEPAITLTPDRPVPYLDPTGQYYQQIVTIHSTAWIGDTPGTLGSFRLEWANQSEVPAGTKIYTADGTDITGTMEVQAENNGSHNFNAQIKIMYPKDAVDAGISAGPELTVYGLLAGNNIFTAYYIADSPGGSPTYQRYLVEGDPKQEIEASLLSQFLPDVDYDMGLRIVKVEAGTNIPLEGAVFEVFDPDGTRIYSLPTNAAGLIDLPLARAGSYTVTETVPPRYHLPATAQTRNVTVRYGEVAEVTFANDPYGTLRVRKVDAANGNPLTGATVRIKNIVQSFTRTGTTDASGFAVFEKLSVGAYEIVELTAPQGYALDGAPRTVSVTPLSEGEISYTLTNKANPGLRIVKLDRQTMKPIENVSFEVWHDGELYGTYITDAQGEILLRDIPAGTYTAREVAVPNGYVLDPTAQRIELRDGQGYIFELYFFNLTKPGMYLVKVDSATLGPLPNARFRIAKVDGAFSNEYTTDINGEIDLSALESGAYQVTELAAPAGYLIDGGTRTVQLNPGENARFVFTDTKKPMFELVKLDSKTGRPLAGATFRIAKIEDGTHYLDRVTDTDGKIVIDNLEPGVYSAQELTAPEGYVRDETEYHAELFPGKTSTLVVSNAHKPDLKIVKRDADTGSLLANAGFKVRKADGATYATVTTDANGEAYLYALDPGVYEITETLPPPGYLPNETPQLITLFPNRTGIAEFANHKKPGLTILKIDEMTGLPLAGAEFSVRHKDGSVIWEGLTDERGEIHLSELDADWYTITEIAAPYGYLIANEPKDVKFAPGETVQVKFDNRPRPALKIVKVDEQTKKPLAGAKFRLRKTEDDTTGEYVTGEDGTVTIYNLDEAIYTAREISAPKGYILEPQHKDIELEWGKIKELVFTNREKPALVILKLDAVTAKPLAGAEFSVKHKDGSVIWEGLTDENGEIRLTELDADWYTIAEILPPNGYIADTAPRDVLFEPDKTPQVKFDNTRKPVLVFQKTNALTGEGIPGATFKVEYEQADGGMLTLGSFKTDKDGRIIIPRVNPGRYVLTETLPAQGFSLPQNPVTRLYVSAGQNAYLPEFEQYYGGVAEVNGAEEPGGAEPALAAEASHIFTMSAEEHGGGAYLVQGEGYNWPLNSVVIKKTHAITGELLAGAAFELYRADEQVSGVPGTTIGRYTTDNSGVVVITGLDPGYYVMKEVQAPPNFLISENSLQNGYLKSDGTSILEFTFANYPYGGLLITKADAETGEPLAGARFKVTEAGGAVVGNANGEYETDANGEILIPNLKPGAYVVTEVAAPAGYDLTSPPKTIDIGTDGKTYTAAFEDAPKGGLHLVKLDEEKRTPIEGVEFELARMNGERLGTYRTNASGVIALSDLESDWYTIVEKSAPKGYIAEDTVHEFEIKDGETTRLEITNRKASSLMIRKTDSVTGKGIYGVTFILYDANKNPILQLVTDGAGYAYPDTDLSNGRYYIRELAPAEGYEPDDELKTIFVEYGKTSLIEWKNKPITAQIQIVKYSSDSNSVTGAPAGSTLKGAVFEVTRARSGAVVCHVTSDARGVAATEPLPLGRYFVTEVTAPPFYQISPERHEAELEYPGQIVRISAYDKSAELGTTIGKRGNIEVLAGDTMRYDFSDICNTSNVPLSDFYLSDRLPTDAARAVTFVTGTYSQRLYYRVLYKTNHNGYRTLAQNLLSTNNYSFDLTENVLGLMPGEIVTDIKLEFGTVGAGFQSVTNPMLTVRTLPNLPAGYKIINRCEVGGVYQGAPQVSTAAWLTSVVRFGPAQSLPKTGY